jgi:hypothetical protein
MKKFYILTLLVMFTFSLFAKKVEIEVAETIAKNYYVIQYEQIKGSTTETPSVLETLTQKKENKILIYIFNFRDGFTIVSADDAVVPILGFSLTGKYQEENQPPALIDLIQHYKDQIDYAIKNRIKGSDETLSLWSFYTNSDNNRDSNCEIWPKYFIVNPLLTTTWNQNCYYNDKCPYDVKAPSYPVNYCNHVPNGCVALAMAQVMKYWDYPTNGTGSHGYYDGASNPDGYGYQSANFGTTTYDWDAMPNVLTGSGLPTDGKSSSNLIDAVSTLIYHCGVSVDMDYGYNGSGISSNEIYKVPNSLEGYFDYSSLSQYIEKDNYSNSGWESLLRNNLTYNKPIFYVGTGTGGHAFVLDGYIKMQTECCTYYAVFHVNWGWGGSQNGYYYLSDLTPGNFNFNYNQAAVADITPPNLTYDPPAQPSYISEPACSPHCRDIEVDYFVPTVYKTTSYEWDITGIYAAGVTWNGRYASVWSHHYGTATLWCRALNHGVPGPWQTKTIYIENCSRGSNPLGKEVKINKSGESLTNVECNELQNEVRIYPNPASNIINIYVPNSVNYSVVELINNQGETVKSIKSPNRKIVINTNDVSSGLYIIKLSSRNSILLEKVIISK